MKKNILLFVLLAGLLACEYPNDSTEGSFLVFFPRKCSFVCVTPGQALNTLYEGITYTDYKDLDKNYIVENHNLFISIQTSNQDIRKGRNYIRVYYFTGNLDDIDDPIPSLEQQIERDYNLKARQDRSSFPSPLSSNDADVMIRMEYRLTGAQSLKISAIGASLFGKAEGESLSDFFDIIKYDPQIIASSQTHNLLMGFTTPTNELPRSIDEWLSLQPLAQTNMYLRPNASLGVALPVDVQLAVEMETEEGLVLRDTTAVFTITE
jgi:hypothetical protein